MIPAIEPNTTVTPEAVTPVETITPAATPAPVADMHATELAAMRATVEASAAELKKFRDAELTATQRIEQERDEARTQLETVRAEARSERITSIATRLGFADAADANHFLAKDATDIEAALTAVLAAKPYLKVATTPVAPVVTPTSPANPGRSAGSAPVFSKAQVADRAFWNSNKDAIIVAMREGRISG
ncbi:MAG: hypothetical protein M3458_14820 [Acidobacteriota bacterium]|nr:hypothetical protein [Acidobacteriota bacterium]